MTRATVFPGTGPGSKEKTTPGSPEIGRTALTQV
jgi:hypothetical protein